MSIQDSNSNIYEIKKNKKFDYLESNNIDYISTFPNNHNKLSIFNIYKENFKSKFEDITDNFFQKINFSLNCLDDAFINNNNFDINNIFISFNGGKDCLASFILIKYYLFCKENNLDFKIKASFEKFSKEKSPLLKYNKNIKLIYFLNKKNFDVEEDYVYEFSKTENVEIYFIYSDYILGLKFLTEINSLKSIIMGTREDDLKYEFYNSDILIHESTSPYPKFFRFYSVFKFNYEDIWRLILLTKFEYMKLYDEGFSSIGNKLNTKINENLIFEINGKKENGFFLPAWCLKEKVTERCFRESEKNK